jgi:hypothetical protein
MLLLGRRLTFGGRGKIEGKDEYALIAFRVHNPGVSHSIFSFFQLIGHNIVLVYGQVRITQNPHANLVLTNAAKVPNKRLF